MHRSWEGRALGGVLLGLATAVLLGAGGTDGEAVAGFDWNSAEQSARIVADRALDWYRRTPPADRIAWGGLAACAGLGLGVLGERTVRLRRRKIVPRDFVTRFLERLQDGKLDRNKALDFCELNPSPAARVALGAIRRWGRPVPELERGVALAHRAEADRLRRHVGTLRRVAALTPLVGLLGSLVAAGRALSTLDPGSSAAAWGPALASALSPLTAGVAIAVLALVAYDGLVGRVESLAGALDRLGTETLDAIASASTPDAKPTPGVVPRGPHLRVEIPDHLIPHSERDRDFV